MLGELIAEVSIWEEILLNGSFFSINDFDNHYTVILAYFRDLILCALTDESGRKF